MSPEGEAVKEPAVHERSDGREREDPAEVHKRQQEEKAEANLQRQIRQGVVEAPKKKKAAKPKEDSEEKTEA